MLTAALVKINEIRPKCSHIEHLAYHCLDPSSDRIRSFTTVRRNLKIQPITQDAARSSEASRSDREFMSTLAKGLKVLASFGEGRPSLSLTEAADLVGLSRAAARRVLRTLTSLGYVVQHGRRFELAPRVLELGFGFLATQSWIDLVEPHMKALSQMIDESCSAAILQDNEVVYVARMPAPYRLLSTTLTVGTRLPAFHTSLGRIQLGFLADDELRERLRGMRLTPYNAVDDRESGVAHRTYQG
jgi:IclR family pca regulon transcriptional regulator